jgi:diguanylate cyclase (GGDEF)-like protein/PAS domain S-box-containing protein
MPQASSSASEYFATWLPTPAERHDMVEVAAYYIAQRAGFNGNPRECWAAAEAQVDLMLALRESEKKLQTIIDTALDAVVMMDSEGIITGWNIRAENMFGWPRNEAIGRVLHETIIPPQYRESHVSGLKLFLKTGEGRVLNARIETLALHRDGHEFLIEVSVTAVKTGEKFEFSSFIRDITEQSAREKASRLATTVFNTVNEAVVVTDPDNNIIAVNPAFTAVTGYPAEEVIGKNPRLLSSGTHPPEFYREFWGTLISTGSWQGEIWNRRKNGELYVEWLSVNRVLDNMGRLTHHVAAFSDISKRKAVEEKVHHLAHYDPLTDLPNRALFSDRLQQALIAARRDKTHMALMYLDLDQFKPVNDTFGHAVGDLLLKEAAQRMQGCMRESDTVARVGGDEFIVLLPTVEAERDAAAVAEKIRHALNRPFALVGHSLHVSSSIGIAVYPEHGSDEKSLVKNADTAMYYAKESGGDNVRLYQPDMKSGQ